MRFVEVNDGHDTRSINPIQVESLESGGQGKDRNASWTAVTFSSGRLLWVHEHESTLRLRLQRELREAG